MTPQLPKKEKQSFYCVSSASWGLYQHTCKEMHVSKSMRLILDRALQSTLPFLSSPLYEMPDTMQDPSWMDIYSGHCVGRSPACSSQWIGSQAIQWNLSIVVTV